MSSPVRYGQGAAESRSRRLPVTRNLLYAGMAATVVFFPLLASPWVRTWAEAFLLPLPVAFLVWLGYHWRLERRGMKRSRSALAAVPLALLVFLALGAVGAVQGLWPVAALTLIGANVLVGLLLPYFLVKNFTREGAHSDRLLASALVYLAMPAVVGFILSLDIGPYYLVPWLFLLGIPPLLALAVLVVTILRWGAVWSGWRALVSVGTYASLMALLLALGALPAMVWFFAPFWPLGLYGPVYAQ